MLLTIIENHPERLKDFVAATPFWTWTLLAALLWIGATQLRPRITTARSAWSASLLLAGMGVASFLYSFRRSSHVVDGTLLWLGVALAVMHLIWPIALSVRQTHGAPPEGDAVEVLGSLVPLGLITLAFLSRYWATLEISVNPEVIQDGPFVLSMAGIYGLVSGAFLARARATSKAIEAKNSRKMPT